MLPIAFRFLDCHHSDYMNSRQVYRDCFCLVGDPIGSGIYAGRLVYFRLIEDAGDTLIYLRIDSLDNGRCFSATVRTVKIYPVVFYINEFAYEVRIRLEVELKLQRPDKIIETAQYRAVLETIR